MKVEEEDYIAHYGTPRHSGRYPWGSGDANPESTRNRHFLQTVKHLRQQGMSESEIAKGMGISVTKLRAQKSIANAQVRQDKITTAQRLADRGWSKSEIGRRMNLNESSVRALLAPGEIDKASATQSTANMLKRQVDEKKYIDIGAGVEHQIGVTNTHLKTSVAILEEQGYRVHPIKVQQANTGKYTTMKVLTPPGTTLSEVRQNRAQIRQIQEYSQDHGRSFLKVQPPLTIKEKRVGVNYAEDGGGKADGMIYLRPGVKDLSMGTSPYSQVRIALDDGHFLKGMAVYKEDLPEGKDIVFNTKKSKADGWKSDSNRISDDPDLPFGAITRQVHGPDGKVTSAMNIVGQKEGAGQEGGWDSWSRNLPAQMLSKQSPDLAKQQLDLTYERRVRELDEIRSLTNPTVKKDLLVKFGDQTDAAAVHLKAAALPKQSNKVLLPVQSMKPTEIYAPGIRDGTRVALVRFPHGGPFEIPQLTVNNRNREARKMMGTGKETLRHDAVGIHHSVAERLSGADFDGDTVLLIPNNKGLVKSNPALEGLKGFDPMKYKIPKDSPLPRMTSAQKGAEMGKVSNLITDMSLRGASSDDLARAIRHSMVVIDAEKHELDWHQSEKDNGILALKEEYQGGKRRGASTLISQAKAEERIPQRVERPARRGGPIDPVTGKRVYEETGYQRETRKKVRDPVTGEIKYVPTGKIEPVMEKHHRLAVTENAFELSSGTRMEVIYATHSNKLKALANQARKESLPLKGTPVSPSAKATYSNEVESLNKKLRIAERNAPYERQAQLLTQAAVGQKRQANPHMEPEEVKKIKNQALTEYRIRTGAKKGKITITQSEWDAIQAGAISQSKLEKILKNSDADTVKMLAMPKHTPTMTNTKKRRAQSMLDSGFTQVEVADALGVGVSTLRLSLQE